MLSSAIPYLKLETNWPCFGGAFVPRTNGVVNVSAIVEVVQDVKDTKNWSSSVVDDGRSLQPKRMLLHQLPRGMHILLYTLHTAALCSSILT